MFFDTQHFQTNYFNTIAADKSTTKKIKSIVNMEESEIISKQIYDKLKSSIRKLELYQTNPSLDKDKQFFVLNDVYNNVQLATTLFKNTDKIMTYLKSVLLKIDKYQKLNNLNSSVENQQIAFDNILNLIKLIENVMNNYYSFHFIYPLTKHDDFMYQKRLINSIKESPPTPIITNKSRSNSLKFSSTSNSSHTRKSRNKIVDENSEQVKKYFNFVKRMSNNPNANFIYIREAEKLADNKYPYPKDATIEEKENINTLRISYVNELLKKVHIMNFTKYNGKTKNTITIQKNKLSSTAVAQKTKTNGNNDFINELKEKFSKIDQNPILKPMKEDNNNNTNTKSKSPQIKYTLRKISLNKKESPTIISESKSPKKLVKLRQTTSNTIKKSDDLRVPFYKMPSKTKMDRLLLPKPSLVDNNPPLSSSLKINVNDVTENNNTKIPKMDRISTYLKLKKQSRINEEIANKFSNVK